MKGETEMGSEQQGQWTEKDQNKAAEKGQGAEIGGQSSNDEGGTQKAGATSKKQQASDKSSQGSSGGTSGS
jgi:hypothetical protein